MFEINCYNYKRCQGLNCELMMGSTFEMEGEQVYLAEPDGQNHIYFIIEGESLVGLGGLSFKAAANDLVFVASDKGIEMHCISENLRVLHIAFHIYILQSSGYDEENNVLTRSYTRCKMVTREIINIAKYNAMYAMLSQIIHEIEWQHKMYISVVKSLLDQLVITLFRAEGIMPSPIEHINSIAFWSGPEGDFEIPEDTELFLSDVEFFSGCDSIDANDRILGMICPQRYYIEKERSMDKVVCYTAEEERLMDKPTQVIASFAKTNFKVWFFLERGIKDMNLRPFINNGYVRFYARCNKSFRCVFSMYHQATYGGIIRSVELMPFSGLYVRELKLCYELQGNKAEVCAEALCSGDGTVEYTLLVEGKSIKRVILQKGVNHISFTLEQVKLWSCENPRLYNITLASDSDSITERTGFRTVCVSENSVLLNGEPIRLKGINRHDEHPDWGFSVPDQLEKRDFELIKQLGCNALRGAHYPQKEYLLDLCDEYGILYWSEIPLWQYRVSNFCEKKVLSRGKTMMCEMITAYYNHPSIFVWGLHNECSTETAEGVNFTRELYNTVKQLDNSRLISYATDRPLEDKCFEFCDFISINKYYGWYEGESSEWKPFLEKLEKMLVKKGFSGKPVVISEFGAAALYGHRTMENEKWTEDYQSRCIENAMKVFAYKPYIVGTFIWQFANLRVDPNRSLDRAHGYNNKGILDEYRRPKKAYYTLMNLYHEK